MLITNRMRPAYSAGSRQSKLVGAWIVSKTDIINRALTTDKMNKIKLYTLYIRYLPPSVKTRNDLFFIISKEPKTKKNKRMYRSALYTVAFSSSCTATLMIEFSSSSADSSRPWDSQGSMISW